MSSNEAQQVASAETSIGPGARLRKERESQGLEQARVAAQLHLSEAMVEALEWDDFDALPGVVFTRGYLHNYARLLGLPEKEILDSYQSLCPAPDRDGLTTKRSVQIKHEVHSSHGLVQLATWLIVIGLIALLFIWWQGRFGWQDETAGDFQSEAEIVQPPPVWDDVQLPETPAASPYAEVTEADLSVQTEVLPQAVIEDQPEPLNDPQADDLQPLAEQTPDSEPESTPSGEDVVTLSQGQTPVLEGAPDIKQEPAAVTSGLLVVEFTGTCWAEVRDASGRAHILGEKRAGIRYELEADLGPFKVVLGNARAVNLTLDGEPYDLAPHTSGNVARFTLETEKVSEQPATL